MKPVDPFPRLLHAFFYEWMVQQRNASAHTVRSYRDTWRLFLRFVAQRRHRPIAQLTLGDLTAFEVKAFLQYTEQERGDTIGTRNCRLSALRSFFGFVADREPTAIEQCTQVLHVPMKKAPIHAPCYLEPEEVKAILAQPDRSTSEGQRDHAFFSFLYNTGARIQEALDVCPRAIRFDSPTCVRLYGKGRKERLSPLWPETVSLRHDLQETSITRSATYQPTSLGPAACPSLSGIQQSKSCQHSRHFASARKPCGDMTTTHGSMPSGTLH
ncbi:site-specific integrase [Bradyrhizobium sp. 35]|uniref:tyrosine-type recombinase/integrase n=1 Tax=Bradyrhizobium sp. 35 TaxID=2782670 RepID=UPI001FF9F6B8|nr:site-specific integrase [Bradyrhizobium sp. 35]